MIIILPTRGRPENVRRFWEHWKENTDGESKVVLMIDDDDNNNYDYTGFKISKDKRDCLSVKINDGIKKFWDGENVIGFLADDVTIEAKYFDSRIEGLLSHKKYGLLHADDGYSDSVVPNHVFMTRELYELLGWFAYPKLLHIRLDYVWMEIGKFLNKGHGSYIFARHLLIKHRHFYYDKSVEEDSIYKQIYSKERVELENKIWENEWPEDFEIIKKRICEEKK